MASVAGLGAGVKKKAADIERRRKEMETRLFSWHNDHDASWAGKAYDCKELGICIIGWRGHLWHAKWEYLTPLPPGVEIPEPE